MGVTLRFGKDKLMPTPLMGSVMGNPKGDFMIAEWVDEGSDDASRMLIAPFHTHHQCDEAWYVLEGTLCVQRDEEVVTAEAGEAILVTRGTKHSYWNGSSQRLRYLLVMTPKTYQLIEAIHQTDDRSFEGLSQLFANFDATYYGF